MSEAEDYELPGDLRGLERRSEVERLFREHNDTLVKFLRRRVKTEADAREAAQEAYVRLLQLDHTETVSFLRAYLFKIAANVATDMLRRQTVKDRVHQDTWFPEFISPTAAHERAFQAREQLRAVDCALCELPPRCREAFLLNRHEGWGTARIAAHLGVTDRMVRLYLTRALEHVERAVRAQDN